MLWSGLPSTKPLTVKLSEGDWDKRIAPVLSADGKTAAIAKADGRTVVLHRAIPASKEHRIAVPDAIRSLALSPDGATLAVGFDNGEVGLWPTDSSGSGPRYLRRMHSAPVAGLQFTADGKRLVSSASGGGGLDRNIAVSTIPRLDDVHSLRAQLPNGSASALSASRADGLLAIADVDGRILLADLSELRFVAQFSAGGSWIPALILDDDHSHLIAAGSDGALREWNLKLDDWIALACAKANRSLTLEEWSELRPNDPYDPGCTKADRVSGRKGDGDGRS